MKASPLNIIFATIWFCAFAYLAYQIYTDGFADYSSRKGRSVVMLIEGLVAQFGHALVSGVTLLLGIAMSSWVLWGKESKD